MWSDTHITVAESIERDEAAIAVAKASPSCARVLTSGPSSVYRFLCERPCITTPTCSKVDGNDDEMLVAGSIRGSRGSHGDSETADEVVTQRRRTGDAAETTVYAPAHV